MEQKAEDIEKEVTELIERCGGKDFLPTYKIKQFSVCYARWLECEEKNTSLGLIAKHPSGAAVQSPYVKIALEYLREANDLWNELQNLVKEQANKISYKKFMEGHKYGHK